MLFYSLFCTGAGAASSLRIDQPRSPPCSDGGANWLSAATTPAKTLPQERSGAASFIAGCASRADLAVPPAPESQRCGQPCKPAAAMQPTLQLRLARPPKRAPKKYAHPLTRQRSRSSPLYRPLLANAEGKYS